VVSSDGVIYVGSWDGNLYAINRDGTLKWKFDMGNATYSSPTIQKFDVGSQLYIGSENGKLYALDPATGRLQWAFATDSPIRSSPTIGLDGTVYVASFYGSLYAIEPISGSLKWALYDFTDRINSSPAIGPDGTIYVGSSDGKLYAINPNGTLKWTYETAVGEPITSSPAISSSGVIYFGTWGFGHGIYAVNPDGTLKWSLNMPDDILSSPAIASDGTIYIGCSDHKLYAITPDGKIKWAFTTGGAIDSSPAIGSDGTIYVGSWDGNVYAIAPDGSLKWKFRPTPPNVYSDPFLSSPAIGSDGTIYIASLGGVLYAIGDAEPPSWRNQGQNATTIHQGKPVLLYAQGMDKVGLDWAWLETNETGRWEAKTGFYGSPMDMQDVAGVWAWSNFTWCNASVPAGTNVAWRIGYNDTSGNVAYTDVMTFRVVAEIHVPDQYPTIQEAINAAPEGSFIIVHPGIYAENVVVNKTLSISSIGGPSVTIVRAKSPVDVFKVTARNVKISGFTISGELYGSPISPNAGVALYANNSVIRDNFINTTYIGVLIRSHNNIVDSCTISGARYGVVVGGVMEVGGFANNTISNSVITRCRDCAVRLGSGNRLIANSITSNRECGVSAGDCNLIKDNKITSNKYWDGFEWRGRGIGVGSNNTLINNTVSENVIGIELSGGNTLTSNRLSNNLKYNLRNLPSYFHPEYSENFIDETNTVNGRPILYIYNKHNLVVENRELGHLTIVWSSNITIRNNVIDGDGIFVAFSPGSRIISNMILNSWEGIEVFGYVGTGDTFLSNVTIAENRILNHSIGIYIVRCSNNIIVDNVISNNSVGLFLHMESYNNTIKHNNISGNDIGVRIHTRYEGPAHPILLNNITSNSKYGIYWTGGYAEVHLNNIVGNGLFGISDPPEIEIIRPRKDAIFNWWGDPTGPYNPTTNPNGKGNAVSDYVDYEPWLQAPVKNASLTELHQKAVLIANLARSQNMLILSGEEGLIYDMLEWYFGFEVSVINHTDVSTFNFSPYGVAVVAWDPYWKTAPKNYSNLVNSGIGIVFMSADVDQIGLGKYLGISSGAWINVTNNAHYITSSLPLGNVTVYYEPCWRSYINATEGTDVLATIPEGDVIVARGRRVYFGLVNVSQLIENEPFGLFLKSVEYATLPEDRVVDATAEADVLMILHSFRFKTKVYAIAYSQNPCAAFAGDMGKYWDIYVSDVTAMGSLEIRFYYTDADISGFNESSLRILWWNGTSWRMSSNQTLHTTSDLPRYSGYISVFVTPDSKPSLANLTGTPFALATSAMRPRIIHEGDILLKGNETLAIENCEFVQTGNIIVKDEAKIIIQNATLLLNTTYGIWNQYSISVSGSGNLTAINANITALGLGFRIEFSSHSTGKIANSTISAKHDPRGIWVRASTYSKVSVENSRIDVLELLDFSSLKATNLTVNLRLSALRNSFIHVNNSRVPIHVWGAPSLNIENSRLARLTLDFYETDAILTGLHSNALLSYWDLHKNNTILRTSIYQLTLRNSYVCDWIIYSGHHSNVTIQNSTITFAGAIDWYKGEPSILILQDSTVTGGLGASNSTIILQNSTCLVPYYAGRGISIFENADLRTSVTISGWAPMGPPWSPIIYEEGIIFNMSAITPPTPPEGLASINSISIDIATRGKGIFYWALINMSYSDGDIIGKNIDESSLAIYWWNETAQRWIRCNNTGVDPALNIVWAKVATTSTIYAALGEVVKPYGLLRVETVPPVVTTIYVDGFPRNDWGLDWVKLPEGNYSLSFTDVPGFLTPTYVNVTVYPPGYPTVTVPLTEKIPVYAGKTTEVKAYFIQAGYLRVETSPALPATIFVNGYPMNDWGLWVTLKPGNYTVSFQDISGYMTPPPITVSVIAGRHTHVVGNYTSGQSYVKSSPSSSASSFLRSTTSNDLGEFAHAAGLLSALIAGILLFIRRHGSDGSSWGRWGCA
jgi:parallel beta-helix repeat protein